MNFKIILNIIIKIAYATAKENGMKTMNDNEINDNYKELGDHTMVTDSEAFPYVVAILKKTTYLSAGALIDDSWVLTAADSLFLIRESSRTLRVRLGSINRRKGGILMPIKYFQIHPYFDDNKPQYDIALIRLSQPVKFTTKLNPVRLQTRARNVSATHFIVTGWQTGYKDPPAEAHHLDSMEAIKRRRLLSVSHLHPSDPEECEQQLSVADLNLTDTLMCLDPADKRDACERQTGAPVVLNGILWGVVSSWKPEDCDVDPGATFVVLAAAGRVGTWIRATMRQESWVAKATEKYTEGQTVNEDFNES